MPTWSGANHPDGRVVFAGAHEDLVVFRSATGRCESIATKGAWLGAMKDIRKHVHEGSFTLLPNDLLVLYSDGIVEAANASREEFGPERLERAVEANAGRGAQAVVTALMESAAAWGPIQKDDLSALVVRRMA